MAFNTKAMGITSDACTILQLQEEDYRFGESSHSLQAMRAADGRVLRRIHFKEWVGNDCVVIEEGLSTFYTVNLNSGRVTQNLKMGITSQDGAHNARSGMFGLEIFNLVTNQTVFELRDRDNTKASPIAWIENKLLIQKSNGDFFLWDPERGIQPSFRLEAKGGLFHRCGFFGNKLIVSRETGWGIWDIELGDLIFYYPNSIYKHSHYVDASRLFVERYDRTADQFITELWNISIQALEYVFKQRVELWHIQYMHSGGILFYDANGLHREAISDDITWDVLGEVGSFSTPDKSPQYIAVKSKRLSLNGGFRQVAVLDSGTGETIVTLRAEEPIWYTHTDWSPDGSYLAIGDTRGTITILNVARQQIGTFRTITGSEVGLIYWSPDGQKLAVSNEFHVEIYKPFALTSLASM